MKKSSSSNSDFENASSYEHEDYAEDPQNSAQDSNHSENSSLRAWLNSGRVGKLLFYFFTIAILVLSFVSSMGWVPIFDSVLGSLTLGASIVGTAGYSVFKNYGTYNGDGKQKGNKNLVKEINEMIIAEHEIKDESKKYMIMNFSVNAVASSFALISTSMNIPAKLDSEHDGVWWLGIPAAVIGGSAALLILLAHEISSYKQRSINDSLMAKINDDKEKKRAYETSELKHTNEMLSKKLDSFSIFYNSLLENDMKSVLEQQKINLENNLEDFKKEENALVLEISSDSSSSSGEQSSKEELQDKLNLIRHRIEKINYKIDELEGLIKATESISSFLR